MSNNTVIYTNIPSLLESCTTIKARIAMLDTILNGVETALITAATTGQFESYRLDTGQTKNEVTYRSLTELQVAYAALLKTQQMLYARYNINRQGRIQRLIDNKNFIGRYNGGGFNGFF